VTPQELHELDGWLAEHVLTDDPAPMDVESPTQIPKDTLAVLEKCLEKASRNLLIYKFGDNYYLAHMNILIECESLTVGICLLAKELFSRK